MDWLIVFLAKYLIFGVVFIALLTVVGLPKHQQKQMILAIFLAGISAVIISKIAGALYFHPRPFVTEHIKPLVAHGNDNGFPSEHTILAMTLSTVLYYYKKQLALAAFILTLGVGIGRVLAHVHSPLDILGGLIIGTLAGAIGFYGARKLLDSSGFSARRPAKHR